MVSKKVLVSVSKKFVIEKSIEIGKNLVSKKVSDSVCSDFLFRHTLDRPASGHKIQIIMCVVNILCHCYNVVIPEGSSAMPGKSDDEGTIVAIVCWPEWLHDDGDGGGVFLGW